MWVQSNLQAFMQTCLVKLLLRVITSINKNVELSQQAQQGFFICLVVVFFSSSCSALKKNPLGAPGASDILSCSACPVVFN